MGQSVAFRAGYPRSAQTAACMYFSTLLLLFGEMAIYFGAMLAVFRVRHLIGIGAFFCALGATHFLETYLAVAFYVKLPLGLSLSPGSSVLFAGKLTLLLLTYIREDGAMARQPLYGMMLGNFIIVLLVALLTLDHVRLPLPQSLDVAFLGKFVVLMLWGSLLLFLECLLMFALYEQLSRRLRCGLWMSVFGTLLLALTIDQIGYFTALHLTFGIPLAAGLGGWLGKMVAAAVFGGALIWYLTRIEALPVARGRSLREVWHALRPRAPASAVPMGRYDPLTGALHGDQFEPVCAHLLSITALTGRPMSLLLMRVDGLDLPPEPMRPGTCDRIMRRIGEAIGEGLRTGDYVVRTHDHTFAVLTPGAAHQAGMQVAAMLRARVEALDSGRDGARHTLCIGVATTPQDAQSVADLVEIAEQRLGHARQAGANRVVGMFAG